jgi:hypothetical protein
VHAFDDRSLMETLAAQGQTVRGARRLAGNVPIAVTPVTLKPRFNAVATATQADAPPGELPAAVDPRQMSLLGAAWTLGSLTHLLRSGAQSVTYYETTGWRGVMETPDGSPLPDRFPSLPGSVFPMYHVFADIAEYAGGELLPLASSDPRRVDGIALRRTRSGGETRVLLANLTHDDQIAMLAADTAECRLRRLNEESALAAMLSPEEHRSQSDIVRVTGGFVELNLPAYAVTCIDLA